MTLETLGQDPLEMLVEQALRRLSDGEPPSRIEVERVDVKEEPGRRGAGGAVSPGKRENEQAASYLAEEMACMANTPGGGALIVGSPTTAPGSAPDSMRTGSVIASGSSRRTNSRSRPAQRTSTGVAF